MSLRRTAKKNIQQKFTLQHSTTQLTKNIRRIAALLGTTVAERWHSGGGRGGAAGASTCASVKIGFPLKGCFCTR